VQRRAGDNASQGWLYHIHAREALELFIQDYAIFGQQNKGIRKDSTLDCPHDLHMLSRGCGIQ